MTRWAFLRASAAALSAARLTEAAASADPAGCGGLGDIEHFVFMLQENRSFDHYFGTLSSVRGFDDPAAPTRIAGGRTRSVFEQAGFAPGVGATADGYLLPFRLDTTHPSINGECLNDPAHRWGPQHECWNGGQMDGFVRTHVAMDGATDGPVVMGHYTRADLPLHYQLADAFTVCDRYHSSVLGPTTPNRLYWMSATIDPDGTHGGPLVETPLPGASAALNGAFRWMTYPEALQQAGVSWKVYQSNGLLTQIGASLYLSNVLDYLAAFRDPATALHQNGLVPSFPSSFERDVAAGTLPQVSWIVASPIESEHPGEPPAFGEYIIGRVLRALIGNPAVWEKTAFILSYDENGGFFDHVPPPTAPPGTPGEYLTVDVATVPQAAGVVGPIGLGFRTPTLIISPFSRGGLVCSDVFDHTSQLRLLERRFGVAVPNLSAWRRSVVGDLTSTFNFAATPDASVPPLSAPSLTDPIVLAQCKFGLNALAAPLHVGDPYPVPPNAMPSQEAGPVRGRPSGPVAPCAAVAPTHSTAATPVWRRPVVDGAAAATVVAVGGGLAWARRRADRRRAAHVQPAPAEQPGPDAPG